MTVGNPKQAKVLGAIALAMVSYAVSRFLPSPSPSVQNGATGGDFAQASSEKGTHKEAALQRDPFLHLALLSPPRSTSSKPSQVAEDSKPPKKMTIPPFDPGGFKPADPGDLPGVEGSAPAEDTGEPRNTSVESRTTLKLTGVVKVEAYVAYLEVEGTGLVKAKTGDLVAGWTVFVEQSGITLKHSGVAKRLRVGQETEL